MKKTAYKICIPVIILTACLWAYVHFVALPQRAVTLTISPLEIANAYAGRPVFFLCVGVTASLLVIRSVSGRLLSLQKLSLLLGIILICLCCGSLIAVLSGSGAPFFAGIANIVFPHPAWFLIPGALIGIGINR